MAVLYECGFEAGSWAYYQANGWTSGGTPTFQTTTGQVHKSMSSNGGTYGMCLGGANTASPQISGITNDGGWASFWLAPLTYGRSCDVNFRQVSGGTWYAQAGIRFDEFGMAYIITSGLWPVVDAAAFGPFNPKLPHWISIWMKCGLSGSCKVYVDGVKIIEYTGTLRYYIYTLEGWARVSFDGGYNAVYVDDLVVHDSSFTGPLKERFIAPIVPDGNNAVELTASSGTNYQCVDEIPPSTSDYCSTAVTNKADHYNMTTIGWTPDNIDCVGVWTWAMQNGTITQLKHGLYDSGGPTEYTKTVTLTTSGTTYADLYVFDTEPISSTAWDKTEIDAVVSTARLV